jgi:hypothetical protein
VSASDLSSIEGLEEKHLRALARHGVTDLRGLVQANREVIHRAMANLRPRPPRDLIARWQDDARSLLAETTPDATEWQMVASFVVVFFQRRAGDAWERRVEAERTEVEPERNPSVWPGWEAAPICEWMVGQLGQASGAEPDGGEPASGDGAVDAAAEISGGAAVAEVSAGSAVAAGAEDTAVAEGAPGAEDTAGGAGADERPALRIDSVAIIDAAGRADVVAAGAVAAGAVAAGPPRELVAPARVAFTVSGARPKTRLWAVARILRGDGPGRNARDPVAVPDSGNVELDLSVAPVGEYDVRLIAWAPDATAKPASVRLPAIRIRAG